MEPYQYEPFVSDDIEDSDGEDLPSSNDEFKHRLGNNEWLAIMKNGLCACAALHVVNIALYPQIIVGVLVAIVHQWLLLAKVYVVTRLNL